MEQLSLFAVEVDDVSNVDMWGAEDFIRLIKNGDRDTYVRAMIEKGISERVATDILHVGETQWKSVIETAIALRETGFGSFTFGSSEEAVRANLDTLFGRFLTKTYKNKKAYDVLYPLFQEAASLWAGNKVWHFTDISSYRKPEEWMKSIALSCRFLEMVDELHAEEIQPSEARIGDEIILTAHNAIYRGWLVKGEITRYTDGSESIDCTIWVQNKHEQQFGWQYGAVSEYQEWMMNNPLTKALSEREVRSIWTPDKVYRIGHNETIKGAFPPSEHVLEALFSLPLPETPELLWEMAKGSYNDWIHHFCEDEMRYFWQEYMKCYTPDDALRVVMGGACKPSRRGSQFDRLPPDETIEPFVQALVEAETFEQIETALNTYYWIGKESYSTHYDICTITHGNCYENLYKSAMAQTKDRSLIILLMQDFARNPDLMGRVASWTPEDGLQIKPCDSSQPEQLQGEWIKESERLQNMVCLGVYDKSEQTPVEDEEEEEMLDDDCGNGCGIDCEYDDEDEE